MENLVLFALLASALVFALHPFVLRALGALLSRQRADIAVEFVAESWLEWEVCRGSTMFRQGCASEEEALSAARRHARLLDHVLPTHYLSEDWCGRPTLERYPFEIRWGVRRVTETERIDGVQSIWSAELPGAVGYQGEHASAHPLASAAHNGESVQEFPQLGYKL